MLLRLDQPEHFDQSKHFDHALPEVSLITFRTNYQLGLVFERNQGWNHEQRLNATRGPHRFARHIY